MKIRKSITLAFSVIVIASFVLAACGTPNEVPAETKVEEPTSAAAVEEATPEPAEPEVILEKAVFPMQETISGVVAEGVSAVPANEAVTLYWNWSTEPPTLDPALATDTTSVDADNNLFVGLTQFDPVSGEVNPALAESWEVSDDGTVYTFYLRDDIPWVSYDPDSGSFLTYEDENGDTRVVNAYDVEYGVKRTIAPATASDYAYVLYGIENAMAVNESEEGFTLDDVGVKALDATTVEFTLKQAAPWFPGIAGMWITFPQPWWTIEANGESWTEPGLMVTSGPYALEAWIHGSELNLVKSPLWPGADSVQIERIEGVMITESSTAFALWENGELDTTGVPLAEMDRALVEYADELYNAPVPCTYYYGFVNTKPPFDDARVRTAFAQSIDAQSLADNVLKGGQIPATSFAPPGIFGAPAPGEVGLAYDPAAAQASLQAYLDDKGITLEEFNALGITLMHNTSEGHAKIAAAIQQFWSDNLGVEVNVENQEWAVYLETVGSTTPIEDVPHIFRMGWCADYPDENNWVHEVFNSDEGANRLRRNCLDDNCSETTTSEFDELTVAAALEQDPDKRAELYREAERVLAVDEAAYAPIYHYTAVNVSQPWLVRNFPPLGGNDFFNWTIDMDARP